jgi:hypothetical protein
MATGRLRKQAAPAGTRRFKFKARSTCILDKMVPLELASILRAVLAKHPDLRAEAEQIAIAMIAAPSVDPSPLHEAAI